jgi:hypothetical protein
MKSIVLRERSFRIEGRSVMNELVTKLTTGKHPVEIVLRPERTVAALRECIERGYVHIKFTDTRGGTELGVRLDRAQTNLNGEDFSTGQGEVRLAGSLTLDYVPVKCVAIINLSELNGEGWLEPEAAQSQSVAG